MHIRRAPATQPTSQAARLRRGSAHLAPKSISGSAMQTAHQTPSGLSSTLVAMVSALVRWPPVFEMARRKARETIRKRGLSIGVDMDAVMKEYASQQATLNALLTQVTNADVVAPAYYTRSFHAYQEGNLCWDAALEFDVATRSVHAPVMSTDDKMLDPEGDLKMRRSFNMRTRELMAQLGVSCEAVRHAVDLGCSTGVSSLAVLEAFPESSVTGVDLSPYFVAVGQYEQAKRQAATGRTGHRERLTLVHANAEQTGLPSTSFDLVSVCLVCHELPQEATRAIFKEAFRLLRPGGCLAVMEMDPTSPMFQRMFTNPFAFAGFKSTEPWLEEYIALDMQAAMAQAGFTHIAQTRCTPRHKAVVAVKN